MFGNLRIARKKFDIDKKDFEDNGRRKYSFASYWKVVTMGITGKNIRDVYLDGAAALHTNKIFSASFSIEIRRLLNN